MNEWTEMRGSLTPFGYQKRLINILFFFFNFKLSFPVCCCCVVRSEEHWVDVSHTTWGRCYYLQTREKSKSLRGPAWARVLVPVKTCAPGGRTVWGWRIGTKASLLGFNSHRVVKIQWLHPAKVMRIVLGTGIWGGDLAAGCVCESQRESLHKSCPSQGVMLNWHKVVSRELASSHLRLLRDSLGTVHGCGVWTTACCCIIRPYTHVQAPS